MPQATGHWATIGFLIRTNETHSFDRPTSRARPACQLRVLWVDVDEVLDAGDARYYRIQDVSAELSNGVLLLSRICPQRFGVSGCRSTCRLPVRPVGIQLAFARFADGESASVANSGHESGPLVTEPAISARLRRCFRPEKTTEISRRPCAAPSSSFGTRHRKLINMMMSAGSCPEAMVPSATHASTSFVAAAVAGVRVGWRWFASQR